MSQSLIDAIVTYVLDPPAMALADRANAVAAFEDTMAVALAGWDEPVVQHCLAVYGGGGDFELITGDRVATAEHAALVHATAAHALDYDDVHLPSVTHPSAVLVPALLATRSLVPDAASRMLDAFGVGLAVNAALGRAMGFQHYAQGWHATSTFGPISAAAALGHLLRLDERAQRAAIAIAATQSGGFQRNFGTMAKPLQAGNAASAGLRAALLARAGVTASQDIFGGNGFTALYRGIGAPVTLQPEFDTISRKRFPCCYATHRMIGAALALYDRLGGSVERLRQARVVMDVPSGTMQPLHVFDPQSGAEGKFCAAYATATALLTGRVLLGDFETDAIHRRDIRDLMARIAITETMPAGSTRPNLEHGAVEIRIEFTDGSTLESNCAVYPGSPDDPFTAAALDEKLQDCLARFARMSGRTMTLARFRDWIRDSVAIEQEAAE